jgi:hypothetical protein
LLQPSLDWWQIQNPFNGAELPAYISLTPGHSMRPSYVGTGYFPQYCDHWQQDSDSMYCPSSGYPTIKAWAATYFLTGSFGNITMPMGSAGRALVSEESIPLAKMNRSNSGSFTTTADDSLARISANFYTYIKEHKIASIEKTVRARFTVDPSTSIAQPLVAVSCNQFNYAEARLWKSGEMVFPYPKNAASNMTNWVTNTEGWTVPRNTWDFVRPLETVNFTFVDLWNYPNHTSLGAVFTIPYKYRLYNDQGKLVNVTQQSMVIPCSIEARWVNSTMWFEPQVDTVVSVSPTDPVPLLNLVAGGEDDVAVRKRFGISDIIRISPDWARSVNLWTISGKNRSSTNNTTVTTTTNDTMMVSLIRTFIAPYNDSISGNFTARGYTLTVPAHDVITNDDYYSNITGLVAKIIGFQLTDGLSRINSGWAEILAYGSETDPINETITTQSLNRQVGGSAFNLEYNSTAWKNVSASYFEVNYLVHKWGYGWSFQSIITKLAAVVLLVHAAIVLIYLGYMIGVRKNWMTSAWDDIGDLFALAIQSHSAPELQGTCAGVDEATTFKQRIRVREVPAGGDHLELVVGDRGKEMDDGIPRMRTTYG